MSCITLGRQRIVVINKYKLRKKLKIGTRFDVSGINDFENINEIRELHVNCGSGHAPFMVNFSFLVSTDLINNCTRFETCSCSHSEDTTKKPENV